MGGFANQSNIAVASSDQLLNCTPFVGSSYVARSGQVAGSSPYHQFLNNAIQVVDLAGSSPIQWMNWNSLVGSNSRIALNNISTINGTPVGAGITSYTNLSGNNLSNSQVITTPSIVGVSSLNALPISAYQNSNNQFWVSYAVTNTGTQSASLVPGTGVSILTFPNVPIPTVFGREVNVSIPINFSVTTPPASVANLTIDAFLGGSLTNGTSVSANYTITPTTSAGRVTLSGTCTTNGIQPTLIIQVSASANMTVSFVQGAGAVPRQFFFQTLGF
jgi:hypothetical protein